MKKLIKDEMNINDIIHHLDLNEILYGTTTDSVIITDVSLGVPSDLTELDGINYFKNEYIVLAIAKISEPGSELEVKMYLKQIPML